VRARKLRKELTAQRITAALDVTDPEMPDMWHLSYNRDEP
jgi:hypothetical protein